MNMLLLLISGIQWLVAVVLFESVFMVFRTTIVDRVSKLMLARLCWTVLGLWLLLHGLGGAIQFVLGLLPIGLSHIHLIAMRSQDEADIVSVKEMLFNIPAALRFTIRKLKPFLR